MTRDQRGFTLAEVLMAVAVIGLGCVAVLLGFSYATTGTEAGRQQTTAVFLAEQRIELLRSIAVDVSAANYWIDPQIAAGTTQEAYGTIASAPGYRRVTTITDAPVPPGPPGPVNWKRIQVDVLYRPITERGTLTQERQVTVVSLVSRR
ncbi:MAG: type IV pilus modification PilV family protein [Candidatus Rokuibacteriota bacterium]